MHRVPGSSLAIYFEKIQGEYLFQLTRAYIVYEPATQTEYGDSNVGGNCQNVIRIVRVILTYVQNNHSKDRRNGLVFSR